LLSVPPRAAPVGASLLVTPVTVSAGALVLAAFGVLARALHVRAWAR
jgi:hypothetical protein